MASIIPGYNYDIFISYRQKDNKHDGWVTEFVNNLKGELESTFKEEISVYFDINPHDGLLETHDVDASLKEKLKCLIFIPIISRTYCDPKSFAWEHEFKAFVEMASKDQYGLKVKLPNGNVASRVLPVLINDPDPEDRQLLEQELEGRLRGIEFIYREPGVNKPMSRSDAKYPILINKLANAIKDIISGVSGAVNPERKIIEKTIGTRSRRNRILILTILLLLMITAGIFLIPSILKSSRQLDRSIAVLPFFNDSPGNLDEPYLNGLMSEILDNLSAIHQFVVRPRISVEKYRKSEIMSISEIRKDLDVNYIIEGRCQKSGNTIILNIHLIEALNGRQIWTKPYKIELNGAADFYKVQGEITKSIADELETLISPEEKILIQNVSTENLLAYKLYQTGNEAFLRYKVNNDSLSLKKAESEFRASILNDPGFAEPYLGLARVFMAESFWKSLLTESFLDSIPIFCKKALSINKNLSGAYTILGDYYYALNYRKLAQEQYDLALKINPNDFETCYSQGWLLMDEDWVSAITILYKTITLYRGPLQAYYINGVSGAYDAMGFLDKAEYFNQQAFKLNNDSSNYYYYKAFHEFPKLEKSQEYLDKWTKFDTNNLEYMFTKGWFYTLQRKPETALKYLEKWYSLSDSGDPFYYFGPQRLGWSYSQLGKKTKAQRCFNEMLDRCNKMDTLGRVAGELERYNYDLAAVYAYLGNKNKAYENLRKYKANHIVTRLMLELIKVDPMFDSLRQDTEFQQILTEMNATFQSEHDKVAEWIKENDPAPSTKDLVPRSSQKEKGKRKK